MSTEGGCRRLYTQRVHFGGDDRPAPSNRCGTAGPFLVHLFYSVSIQLLNNTTGAQNFSMLVGPENLAHRETTTDEITSQAQLQSDESSRKLKGQWTSES